MPQSGDGEDVGTEDRDWFLFDPEKIRPLAEPSDPPPGQRPVPRPVARHRPPHPSEPTNGPDDAQVRCWALAWPASTAGGNPAPSPRSTA
ncbi:hypothetical protein ACWC5I_04320 [Kitasatospora sp. NPDC001574]